MAIGGFNGSSRISDFRNISGLGVGISLPPFSFACWLYLPVGFPKTDTHFFGLGQSSTTRSVGVFYRQTDQDFVLLHFNGTSGVFRPVTIGGVTEGKWTALVGCLGQDPPNGITAGWVNYKKLYSSEDGTIRTNTVLANMSSANFSRLSIGSSPGPTPIVGPTGMMVAECAVWNEVLNDDEILAYAKGIKPSQIKPNNLKIYIPGIRNIDQDIAGDIVLTKVGDVQAVKHIRRYG